MPNWCNNELIIIGSPENLVEFRDLAAKPLSAEITKDWNPPSHGHLYTENFLPKPRRFQQMTEVEWEKAMWGMKWGINEAEISDDSDLGEIRYSFATAWEPPTQFVGYVSILFPDLKFTLFYDELGNDFMGKMVVQDGAGTHCCRDNVPWDEEEGSLTDLPDEELYPEDKTVECRYELAGLRQSPGGYVLYLMRRCGADPEAAQTLIALED